MPRIDASARKLKVTALVEPAPFVGMSMPPDNAPGRTTLAITVAGRTYTADVATKCPEGRGTDWDASLFSPHHAAAKAPTAKRSE